MRAVILLSGLVLSLTACQGKDSEKKTEQTADSASSSASTTNSDEASNTGTDDATTDTIPDSPLTPDPTGKLAACAKESSNVDEKTIVGNRIPIYEFICDDGFKDFAGSDLASATGVSFKVYSENALLEDPAVKEMADQTKAAALREEILKQSQASIGSLDLPDGLYHIILCDVARHAACSTEVNVGMIDYAAIKGGQLVSFEGGSFGYLPVSGNPFAQP